MPRNSSRRSIRPGERSQLGVVDQIGALDHHQKVLELLRGDGAEADHAVGGGDDRRQFQTAGVHQGIRAHHAGRHGGQAAHRDRHRLVGRDVDDLAAAAPGGVPGGGRGDRRGERARQPLAEPASRLHGFVAGPAAAGDRAGKRLQDELVGDHMVIDIGAGRAERRHGDHHRRRAGVCGDVVQRPTVGQVGEHHVGAGQQRRDLGLVVADHRPLARGQVTEQRAGWPPRPTNRATSRPVGIRFSRRRRPHRRTSCAVRHRDPVGQLQHAPACERRLGLSRSVAQGGGARRRYRSPRPSPAPRPAPAGRTVSSASTRRGRAGWPGGRHG